MQIMDILAAAQGGGAAANLARAFSIEPEAAEQALAALVPRLTDRLERNTLSRGGLADLVAMIGRAEDSSGLDDPKTLASPDVQAGGNAFLEQILGSKDQSRRVAEKAARETGLSEALLKQLLPVVATMVVSGLAKGAGGALGEVMARFGAGGSPLPMPGDPPARSSSGSGDTSRDYAPPRPTKGPAPSRPPLPQGQSPLPLPGDELPGRRRSGGGIGGGRGRSPLDDLSDILRRGGRSGGGGLELPRSPGGGMEIPGGDGGPIRLPQGSGGSSLWNIVRSILGSVLGFESKGFLGWLIRLFVLKWGWGLVKRILARVLAGR